MCSLTRVVSKNKEKWLCSRLFQQKIRRFGATSSTQPQGATSESPIATRNLNVTSKGIRNLLHKDSALLQACGAKASSSKKGGATALLLASSDADSGCCSMVVDKKECLSFTSVYLPQQQIRFWSEVFSSPSCLLRDVCFAFGSFERVVKTKRHGRFEHSEVKFN